MEAAVIRFVKMHGIGNDYVYVDVASDPALEGRFDGEAGRALVRRMSDRHRGIGGDGVILVARPRGGVGAVGADVRMRMFNADGSESEMCGNGVRCVAKFAHDRLGVKQNPIRVETGRGVLGIEYRVQGGRLVEATVDMGEPILDLERVPVDPARVRRGDRENEWALEGAEGGERWTFVSMGNPHAVTFGVPLDARAAGGGDLLGTALGPEAEVHPAFPRRVNVHIAEVVSAREARMRTWERGAGLTQACGTGACAVLVAGVLTGRLEREALIRLPGGDLRIRWDEAVGGAGGGGRGGHVFMTGPAEEVFEGVWPG